MPIHTWQLDPCVCVCVCVCVSLTEGLTAVTEHTLTIHLLSTIFTLYDLLRLLTWLQHHLNQRQTQKITSNSLLILASIVGIIL